MKKFKADYVYPVCAAPIKNGIVTVDDAGTIIAVDDGVSHRKADNDEITTLSGIICPGFINTHCHLELSHLKNKIPQNTGLVNFIKQVQTHRRANDEEVLNAAKIADKEMYKNGIVAVGDISNTDITVPVKKASKLYYHNFIEVFGFSPGSATEVFGKAISMLEGGYKNMPASVTPHAPYSVSKELFRLIRNRCEEVPNLISIHNQESEDENKFYRYKSGDFIDLYKFFNLDISFFKAQARNSIQTIVPLLSNKQKILLVHNTFTNLKDIYFVKRFDRKINWCFCPNANLYIEDKLPKIELFLDQGRNITIGTDSLASNKKLCILEEMRTIQNNFANVDLTNLIKWATLNGAEFLNIATEKGSIAPGKKPGLNLLTHIKDSKITDKTSVERLI